MRPRRRNRAQIRSLCVHHNDLICARFIRWQDFDELHRRSWRIAHFPDQFRLD